MESVALIASELTHNQLSHARQGYFAVKPVERQGVKGLEVMAADMGPGIERPELAIKGDISRRPQPWGRLGGSLQNRRRSRSRQSDFGRRLHRARKFEKPAAALCCEIAIMGRPFPGEAISGDDGVFIQSESGLLPLFRMVSDTDPKRERPRIGLLKC